MPLNFTNTRAIHKFGNWQGAYPLRSTKASRVTIKPSRLIGAADPLHPQLLRANVFPEADIFGRAITNKPGVHPYGSATGTTPVTSTSLKAGTYKSAKIKGKGVTKRKQNALWGRYVPCLPSDTTTYPMYDKGGLKRNLISVTGGGSWGGVAYGNGIFVLLSPRNAFTSTDGMNWTSHSTPSGYTCNCICYGGGKFFIAGQGIMSYSSDCVNWVNVPITSSVVSSITPNSIAYDPTDQTVMVAFEQGNYCWRYNIESETGLAFTPGGSVFTGPFNVFSGESGIYILRYISGDVRLWLRTTTSMTSITLFSSLQRKLVRGAYGNGVYIIQPHDTSTYGYSTTGTSFTDKYFPNSHRSLGIVFANGKFISVSSSEVITSTDGLNWTSLFNEQTTSSFSGIASNGNVIITGGVVNTTNYYRYYDSPPRGKAVHDVIANTHGYLSDAGVYTAESGMTGTDIQLIESVTNSASSSFDSNVKAVDNLEMFVRVKAITGSFYILQSRQNTGATIYGISGAQSGNTINAYGVTSGITRTDGHIYTIKMTMANRAVTLYVKDETTGTEDTKTGTASTSDYSFPSPSTIKLFGDASKLSSGATVYESYIKVNGEYVWQPIPVRVGTQVELLDLVNWQFATRAGSFTAGADISYTRLCPDIIETNVGDALYGEYGENLVSFTRKDAIHLDANFTNGAIAANNDRTALFIPVAGGKTYSFLVSDTLKSAGWYLVQITADVPQIGTPYAIDGVSTFVNRKNYSDYTMTTDTRTKWIGISISESKATTAQFFNQQFMMVEGAIVPTTIVPRQTGLHPSGEQTVTVGDQTRTITTFLPSANSFIDAQKASNNVECDWKFKVLDGTESYAWGNPSVTLSWSGMGTLKTGIAPVCNVLEGAASFTTGAQIIVYNSTSFRLRIPGITGSSDAKQIIADLYNAGTPMILAYPVATPEVTTVTLSEFTQPLGTVTILNEFADGTKGAVDFYGVNIDIVNPVPKPDEPIPLLSNAGEVKVGYIQTQGKVIYDGSSDEVWTYDSGFHRFYLGAASLPADMKLGGTRTQQMFAPNWRCLWHGEAVSTAVNGDFYVGSNNVFFHSPEGSVAAFKAMLQTNPIELYYQRTDDPSFIQPTNGFFGDGQQTVKMESFNLVDKTAVTRSKYLDSTGALVTNSKWTVSDYMPVEGGQTYYQTTNIPGQAPRTCWYDGNKTFISASAQVASGTQTAPSNAAYCRMSIWDDDLDITMFTHGSTAPTTYSPYVTPQTRATSEILPSATSKLNMQGGNDNKDCDVVLVQLDGSENWSVAAEGVMQADILTGNAFGETCVCSHFIYTTSSTFTNMPDNSFRNGSSVYTTRLYVKCSVHATDVPTWKAWVAENKPILAYPRATSVKSTVQTTPFDIPKKTTYVLSSQASDGQALDVQAMCVSE